MVMLPVTIPPSPIRPHPPHLKSAFTVTYYLLLYESITSGRSRSIHPNGIPFLPYLSFHLCLSISHTSCHNVLPVPRAPSLSLLSLLFVRSVGLAE